VASISGAAPTRRLELKARHGATQQSQSLAGPGAGRPLAATGQTFNEVAEQSEPIDPSSCAVAPHVAMLDDRYRSCRRHAGAEALAALTRIGGRWRGRPPPLVDAIEARRQVGGRRAHGRVLTCPQSYVRSSAPMLVRPKAGPVARLFSGGASSNGSLSDSAHR
jgi:hypothetical protein